MSIKNYLSCLCNFRHKQILYLFFLVLLSTQCMVGYAQQMPARPGGPSTFKANLINIEAATSETFRFNTNLYNGTSKSQQYDLKANLPIGWNVSFKVDGNQVTSLNMDAGSTKPISVEINAIMGAKPQKYIIPVSAISGSDTLSINLEAVVKGTYSLEMTTPDGRLSEEVTSGSQKQIHLVVKNTGTIALNDLDLSAQMPNKWDAKFDSSKIKELLPGKTLDVTATVTVPDKTIAGDYASTFNVRNSNANAQAVFRIIVKTSILSGWIGILVILLAIGLVYYLIKKYGRR